MDVGALSGIGAVDFGLFAAGCIAGWGFAQRTAVKLANDRIGELKEAAKIHAESCDKEISMLRDRVQHLEDLRFNLARGDL